VFPNCFHISPGTPKFPLILNGKFYTGSQGFIYNLFFLFKYLGFSLTLLHTQEVGGSNPPAPTIHLFLVSMVHAI